MSPRGTGGFYFGLLVGSQKVGIQIYFKSISNLFLDDSGIVAG